MKQKNKIQLLLIAAFAGLGVMCYAQGKMCKGVPGGYNIVSLQDPSDLSSYQWMEDGKDIGGATAAVYTVPSDKAEGNYTYIRRSKKEGCDWASSNAYTVEVIICKTIGSEDTIGTKGTFKDERDQKVYKIVKMPDGKVWMAENLNYQSGLTFNQQANQAKGITYTNIGDGVGAIGSFWCPAVAGATLSADRNTCNVYGALYTWETAMSADGKGTWDETTVSGRYREGGTTPAASQHALQVQGVCPAGYHLPSDYEWAVLLDAVDPAAEPDYTAQNADGWYGTDAAVKMKSASTHAGVDPGTGSWDDSDARGTNASGFAALPSGSRNAYAINMNARGAMAYLWTSTPNTKTTAWPRDMRSSDPGVRSAPITRSNAYSVRCMANN
jgi:uncharacterized protein (TIGR02145 family)